MTQRRLLVVAVSVGLLTAFCVYAYVRAAINRPLEEQAAVFVVIACEDIRPKTTLTASMLMLTEVDAVNMHPNAIRNIDQAVGRLTRVEILAGQQVLSEQLYGQDERPGLTFVIPPGKRAVSVAVNEVIGVAGFIKPNDRVDILGTFDTGDNNTVTTTVLQDVEVLAIAQKMEDEDTKARVATTVTLALSLQEAEKVTLAEERGSLRLALRPAEQTGKEWVSSVSQSNLANGQQGQSLQRIVPTAKTNTTSSSSAASNATNAEAKATESPPEADNWSVEVYRGVSKEIVQVGTSDTQAGGQN